MDKTKVCNELWKPIHQHATPDERHEEIATDKFMNESGISVSKAKKFFQVENHEILIVHDELDFPAGIEWHSVNT